MGEQKNMIPLSLYIIGFTALSSQIIILRELLIIFYGNEVILGMSLGFWLLFGGLGSFITGKYFLKKVQNHLFVFNFFQILTALYLPFSIYFLRIMPSILNVFPGEIPGNIQTILSVTLVISPLTVFLGAMFATGCEIYKSKNKSGTVPIGYAYILESIGAFTGGIITTVFFIPYLNSFQSQIFLSLLNIISAAVLSRFLFLKFICFIIVFINVFLFQKTTELNTKLLSNIYSENNVLLFKNTHYQNLMVLENEGILSLYINGLYSFSTEDLNAAEITGHLPMIQHNSPKKILLIGGGLSQITSEILKHPVENVLYFESDPLLIPLLTPYFPLSNDSRLSIMTGDARVWLNKNTSKFDIIILAMPPPHTIFFNRFYTKEFFKVVSDHLNTHGVFSFSMPSQENYLSEEQSLFLVSLKNTLESVFSETLITPGGTACFLASNNKNLLTINTKPLLTRLKRRNIKTRYFSNNYIFSEFLPLRFRDLNSQLKQYTDTTINRDFFPISHFFNSILWATHFKYNLSGFFKKLTPVYIYLAALITCMILLLPVLFYKNTGRYRLIAVSASTGFAEISFQIITLLVFQTLYGSVFWKMGIIFSSFMLGLIFGSTWITNQLNKITPGYKWLINTQFAILLYPLILPFIVILLKNAPILEPILLILPVLPGIAGGIQFPLICSIYSKTANTRNGETGGTIYGSDLIGSFAGSVLLSLVIIPALGIIPAISIVFLLNFCGLLLLVSK